MEASAGGGMARVKQEWQEPAWAGDNVVKEEAECVDEEECVKEECSDSRDGCGMSEAAMLAGLYDEHVVKDELVLGPERPHRPTVALVVRSMLIFSLTCRALGDAGGGGGGGAQRARECSVRLERLASHAGAARDHRPRGTAPSDTATPPHTDSDNEQEIYRPNYDKEPVCDLCGERFDLKSDLIKHVAVHIHVPTSADLGAGRPGVSGNAPAVVSGRRRSCAVRLERVLLDAARRSCRVGRRTYKLHTHTHTAEPAHTRNLTIATASYQCHHCGKRFRNKSVLVKHIRAHLPLGASSNSTRENDALEHQQSQQTLHKDKKYFLTVLRKPEMTHRGAKPFKCRYCDYRSCNNLRRHEMIHTGENPFKCNYCDYKCKQKAHLRIHEMIHIGENPFKCKNCDYKCKQKAHLRFHEMIHTGENPFKCKNCDYKCNRKGSLRTHEMIHTGEKPFKCKNCDYKCKQKAHLRVHEMIHTGEKRFKCKNCDYKCKQKAHLRVHEMIHTGEKRFKCNYCDYKCNRKGSLRRHERIHTGEKPFKCNYCDYKCRQKENLRTHEMIHTGEKPFKCNYCDYKCRHKENLQTHEMIHTGEKPFKCNYCDYKCNRKGSLRIHEMIHTGEKPFNCNYCDYKCKKKADLRIHEIIHTERFDCSNCNYKCTNKTSLRRHQMIHSGEHPFQCNYCEYKCRQKAHLKRHMNLHTSLIIRSPRVALCGMEASAGGGMARVKQEWQEPAWAGDHVVKEEAEFVDEEECVKEECSDSRDGCGMSEAAMLAGLYDEHVVKDELVLGPERPHRPTVALVVSNRALGDVDGGFAAGGGGGGGAQRARDCSVRLERLASHAGAARDHRPRGTAPSDTATPPHTDSDNEQEIYRPNYDKEPVCDLCGERFDLKSDLIKHVAVHIHVPTSAELGAGRPGVSGNAPAVVSGRRLSCAVRLERVLLDAAPHTAEPAHTHTAEPAHTHTAEPAHTHTAEPAHTHTAKPAHKRNLTITTASYQCHHCGKRFRNKSVLVKHIRTHVSLGPSRNSTRENDALEHQQSQQTLHKDKKYFVTVLRKPEMTHRGAKPFKCRYCVYTSCSNGHLRRHERIHTGDKPFKCNNCDYKCNQKGFLRRHEMIHTGETPFKCNYCDYKCKQKAHLRIHEMIHTGEKPFKCNYCDYKCKRKTHLRIHEMIHTGETPFKCNYCDYKCNRKSSLRRHEMIHTGETPFKCNYCDYKCKRKAHLRIHEKIHIGETPFKCNYCDYKCKRKAHLRIHEMIHTDEKPFKCNNCDYKCNKKGFLRRHERIHTDGRLRPHDLERTQHVERGSR
ncbi:zinc finger protein 845-like [Cydia strobilella]|uniref:zinc finger protein 845-like n=1 Tax=Cydia strobilella TaxID=1100964 RepID=UPI0030043225